MRFMTNLLSATACACLTISVQAQVVGNTAFNETITAIYDGAQSDAGWTVSENDDVGIQLGLRAIGPDGLPIATDDNVYRVQTGSPDGTQAFWNFDFSINSDTSGNDQVPIDSFEYTLNLDLSPFDSIDNIPINPIWSFTDNYHGNSETPRGGGSPGFTVDFPDATILQNSQNYGFFGSFFDPNEMGTYTISLEAFSLDDDDFSDPLATASIEVVAVPEPSTVAGLSVLVVAGLYLLRRRRK
jgi:hypothetical protein